MKINRNDEKPINQTGRKPIYPFEALNKGDSITIGEYSVELQRRVSVMCGYWSDKLLCKFSTAKDGNKLKVFRDE